MRVLMAIAALLLATSAARAQYSFEYEGRTIRIDPDRGTVSIPGVFDNTPKKSKRARTDPGNDRMHQQTRPDPRTPDQTAPATSAAPANTAPTETAAVPPAAAAAPQAPPSPSAQQDPTPAAVAAPPAPAITAVAPPPALAPKPADNVATAAPPSPLPPAPAQRSQPQGPAPAVHDANSPVGVWLTEEKEGQVRIEPCGANLCGYSVDAKSNQNAEQVLINMKLGKDQKWSGRILDPNTGSTYDSTIALIGGNALRVQGCAFGGMFCGGQTWTRVN